MDDLSPVFPIGAQLVGDEDKKVTQARFATGPIGRIVAEDALRSIQGAKKRKLQGG